MQHAYIDRIADATERLLTTVAKLSDADLAAPSLLPGWTRAMVVKHLADNASGVTRMVEAATRGEVGEKYPGGAQGREAGIREGAGMDAHALHELLTRECSALSAALQSAPDAVWNAPGTFPPRDLKVGTEIVGRLREVEFHHVDLDAGYRPGQWPIGWVMEEIDRLMLGLPERLPEGVALMILANDIDQRWVAGTGDGEPVEGPASELLAWLAGRAGPPGGRSAPELGPWQ